MRRPADMPELREHVSAPGVDTVRDLFPARDLIIGIHSGRAKPSAAGNRNRSRFGDDESSFRSALRVIFEHQLSWNITGLFGPRACEGSHDDAMPQRHGANLHRRKKY